MPETIQSLRDQKSMILAACRHWISRNHEYSPECDGCVDGAAWLAIAGYQGEKHGPLIH